MCLGKPSSSHMTIQAQLNHCILSHPSRKYDLCCFVSTFPQSLRLVQRTWWSLLCSQLFTLFFFCKSFQLSLYWPIASNAAQSRIINKCVHQKTINFITFSVRCKFILVVHSGRCLFCHQSLARWCSTVSLHAIPSPAIGKCNLLSCSL